MKLPASGVSSLLEEKHIPVRPADKKIARFMKAASKR